MTSEGNSPIYVPADAIDVSAVTRVLVIMLKHHGDVLLTSPLLESLSRAVPHVQIDVLLQDDMRPLLEFNPRVSNLFSVDRRWKREGRLASILGEWRLFRALRARSYELVIHLSDHRRGAWLSRGLQPRWSVAPKPGRPSRFWRGSFTHLYANASSVPAGSALARRHTVEQNLDALRRLGISLASSPRLSLVPGPDGERQAADLVHSHGITGDYIVVQPTSRWMFKCWPVAKNAELIRILLARGHTLVLSCAPDPREQAMIRAILEVIGERPERLILAIEGGTLNRLAALIGNARLFIGIDSAPMHIAAAMGTPTVALFGPSGEYNWGPWAGDGALHYRVVTNEQFACRPCGQDGCGGGKISECLVRLPVLQVLRAVDEVLLASDPTFCL